MRGGGRKREGCGMITKRRSNEEHFRVAGREGGGVHWDFLYV